MLGVAPVVISFILVIIALVFTPGTVTSKTKYVHADDRTTKLELKDVSITVSTLSFTLLMLLISFGLSVRSIMSEPV